MKCSVFWSVVECSCVVVVVAECSIVKCNGR